jgi:methyl-accepting chemotaxis protein
MARDLTNIFEKSDSIHKQIKDLQSKINTQNTATEQVAEKAMALKHQSNELNHINDRLTRTLHQDYFNFKHIKRLMQNNKQVAGTCIDVVNSAQHSLDGLHERFKSTKMVFEKISSSQSHLIGKFMQPITMIEESTSLIETLGRPAARLTTHTDDNISNDHRNVDSINELKVTENENTQQAS